MGLADELINNSSRQSRQHSRVLQIEDVPDEIFKKHPSIYKYRGDLYHEHERIRPADHKQIFLLADNHRLRLNPAQCAWVFNRLLERAPPLEDDYIVVSADYAWDKKTGQLIPLTPQVITPNERTTNGRMGQSAESQEDGESVTGGASASS